MFLKLRGRNVQYLQQVSRTLLGCTGQIPKYVYTVRTQDTQVTSDVYGITCFKNGYTFQWIPVSKGSSYSDSSKKLPVVSDDNKLLNCFPMCAVFTCSAQADNLVQD